MWKSPCSIKFTTSTTFQGAGQRLKTHQGSCCCSHRPPPELLCPLKLIPSPSDTNPPPPRPLAPTSPHPVWTWIWRLGGNHAHCLVTRRVGLTLSPFQAWTIEDHEFQCPGNTDPSPGWAELELVSINGGVVLQPLLCLVVPEAKAMGETGMSQLLPLATSKHTKDHKLAQPHYAPLNYNSRSVHPHTLCTRAALNTAG